MACSTAKAIEWDAQWSGNLDPSGRAALGVHESAYDTQPQKIPALISTGNGAAATSKKQRIIEVAAHSVQIQS